MNKKASRGERRLLVVAGLIAIFYATPGAAQTPPDGFYAGGPNDYNLSLPMSETWRIQGYIPSEDPPIMVNGNKVTLRRNAGGVWFLDAENALNWSPRVIRLEDHPDWVEGGVTEQWRWISTAVVQINTHQHRICVGFPFLNTEPKRDDDEIHIAVVDVGEDCEDPTEQHPGHAGAGR